MSMSVGQQNHSFDIPLDSIPLPAAVIRDAHVRAANSLFANLFSGAGIYRGPGTPVGNLFSAPLPSTLVHLLSSPEDFEHPVELGLGLAGGIGKRYIFRFQPMDRSDREDIVCTVQTGVRESILARLPLVTILARSLSPLQIEYISPMIRCWTGYDPEAFLEDPLLLMHIVHPEDKSRFLEAMAGMGKGKEHDSITYRLTNRNGGYVWIRQTREKDVAADNGHSGLLFVLRDITREKEMELDLVEARERYRLFFDKAPIGIACVDRHGIVIDCNEWLCRLFQIPRERLLGLNVLDPSLPFVREYSRKILRGEEVHYEGPYHSIISDKVVNIEVDGFPLRDETGMVIGGFSMFQDISARLELEKTLRQERDFNKAVIDAAATIVLILDRHGNVLQANRTTETITGYAESEISGRAVCDCLIGQKSRKKFLKAFELAVNSMQTAPVDTICTTVDGEERQVEWSFTTINTPDSPVRIIATGVDRTEQRRLEDQFREAQKMDAIGRLAGGVAHEFNNQLTAIQGYCQMLLLNTDPSDSAYTQLKNIEKAVKRSADTANRLLAYSRRQTLQLKRVDIKKVVKESAELFDKLFEENIEVSLKLTDEPCIASMDPNQLQQILLNLALNARDAMPDGGRITTEVFLGKCPCQVNPAEANGRCVFIRVSDTGYGMPRDVLDKAFEPFFTTKPVGKGTGLGLAMVYGTVKQSMGHVTIESREGHGTSVTISLPAQPPEAVEKDDAPVTLVKGDATVIMVEDEKSVNETVTAFLEKLGYRVHPFYSGEEAIEFLTQKQSESPDILLTDVILSGMTGKELADRVKEMYADVRVVYMSGYASDKLADKGIVPRDLTLLYKPFSIFELGETLGRILGGGMATDRCGFIRS